MGRLQGSSQGPAKGAAARMNLRRRRKYSKHLDVRGHSYQAFSLHLPGKLESLHQQAVLSTEPSAGSWDGVPGKELLTTAFILYIHQASPGNCS